jgi:peptide/nickel transport system substrate-binding protein
MPRLTRRFVLKTAGSAIALPRIAFAEADNRPTITIAVQALTTSNTLDPVAEQSNVGSRILNSYVELLIGRNLQSQLEPFPQLATEWKRVDDRTLDVTLRPGVKFHNGDEMIAEDVAFTLGPEHMFSNSAPNGGTIPMDMARPVQRSKELPTQVPAVARRLFPSLDSVKPTDKYTVRLVTATPDITLEGRISAMGSQIINRRWFEEAPSWLDYARAPVGTGPYKVRTYTPDVDLVFDAHDAYWGGRPPIKTLRFVQVPELAQRVNGLRAGQYQFACDITPDQIKTVEGDARLEVAGGIVPNVRLSTFDKYDTAMADPLVRQAMIYAIDRDTIVQQLWAGRTKVPQGLQFPFYADMFVTDWAAPKYDPEKSRALLKEAGYKGDPIPYRLLNDYYTNQTANAQVLAAMWQQVGLNVVIEMKENWSQIWDPAGKRGLHDWSNTAQFNDPVSSIVAQHGPNGQQQQTKEWANDEMNQLCGVLVSSTDRAQRHTAFARMLEICERDDPAYTVLHQNATFTGKLKSIAWKPAPDFPMDFRATNWGALPG